MYKYKMHDKMIIASQKWQLIKIVFFYFYFFLKINLSSFIFPTQNFPKICFPPSMFHLAFSPQSQNLTFYFGFFHPKFVSRSLSRHSSSLSLHPHQPLLLPKLFGSLSKLSASHFQEGVDQPFVYWPHRREEVPWQMPSIEAHFQVPYLWVWSF